MKVTARSAGSPDYLIDIVVDGLVRLLGRDNVHVHYNRIDTQDSTKSQLFQSFGGDNRFPSKEGELLVSSSRVPPAELSEWKKITGRKVIVIDGEDDAALNYQVLELCDVYFKREFFSFIKYPPHVRPLPFAAIPESIPETLGRDIPVTFSAKFTSMIRGDLQKILKDMFPANPSGMYAKGKYNEILARTLVGVSARGAGWDTYRYWETAYFGCALLSQRPQIVIPENFIEGEEAVFFEDANDFKGKLENLLSDALRCRTLGAAARKACAGRHLSVHRAKTVLQSAV